ncbi:MarR family transcriptional regulator [Streptomyces sp. NPDC056460]|uniref:MarR family transcriptional regulator n=1 Tax=Streptomyces sp. NPDC056460 TaxID=3345825 RepID=UPI0036D191EF
MTTTAPRADGRVVALAHHAARARLESVLTRHGITFHQSVTLRAVVAAGGSAGRDELVDDVVGSLKTEASVVAGVIGELTSAKLLEADPADPKRVRLTDGGRELYEATSAESAQVTARLYTGLTDDELEVTGRVLTLITERANAELAAEA